MHPFTTAFLIALTTSSALHLWLSWRQLRHVSAHRQVVPPAFAARISLEAHQKAADYSVTKTRLGMLDILVGAALVLFFTLGGGLQAIVALWSHYFESGGYTHGIAVLLSIAAVSGLIDLPMSLYRTFVVEARFGFNRMTLALFFADLAKQTVIGLTLGIPLIFVVLWLMARMGDAWWLWVWATWAAFNLLMLAIYPTLIAPLFNKFTPLDDDALRTRIEALLAKCQFHAAGLYVMDSSRRTSHGNAYFTGFGKSRRIVFFDTLLKRLTPPEVESVLAHELGHFKRRHIVKRIVLLFAGSFIFLAVLGWLITMPWFHTALGVQSPSTATALALFFLIVPLFTFPLQPIASLYSRAHEFEADQYAVQFSQADDLVSALVKLYEDNAATLTPDPWHSAWHDSHPPATIRIARLRSLATAESPAP